MFDCIVSLIFDVSSQGKIMRNILLYTFLTVLSSSPVCLSFGQNATQAYFGNIHQHTGYSFDAFDGAHRHQPEKTYRYSRGDTILYEDEPLHLVRPLDFLAITDHAEYLGVFPYYDKHAPNHVERHYREMDDGSKQLSHMQFIRVNLSMYAHKPIKAFQNKEVSKQAWQHLIDLAEKYYDPGNFTTFAAFEWTAMTSGFFHAKDRHRCVIYRSTKDLPEIPLSQLDTHDPEDLWDWLDDYRQNSGEEVIAIPHNMNRSGGMSFSTEARNNGEPFDSAYSSQRIENEMLQEVVQRKGQSMEHPGVSPEDKFANFNIREELLSVIPMKAKPKKVPTSYARQGLKKGMVLKNELDVNPFQFGVVGSTDSHSALPWREKKEDDGLNILGKGVAGVWAEENTREAIFDALKRRETFATSGTRLKVRFFGGWQFPKKIDFSSAQWVQKSYQAGIPMGGELPKQPPNAFAPEFLVWAKKDPQGANLDRIQIIKLWVDKNNESHQTIYNVAWAGNRQKDDIGELPKLVSQEDYQKADYDHDDFGSSSLQTVWQDPSFTPHQQAAYYVRVLEVPDQFKHEQDRAWTSPIWYGPHKRPSMTNTH